MNSQIMSMFVRKEPLSAEEWIIFLELARDELKQHLDKFTLKKFGDLGCVHSEEGDFRYHTIFEDNPVITDTPISLNTHGIAYFADSGRCRKVGETRIQEVWGLTKKGEWVVISVVIKLVESKKLGLTRETVVDYCIYPRPLVEVLSHTKVTTFSIWSHICMEVDAWKCWRQRLYDRACNVNEQFRGLDSIVSRFVTMPYPKK